VILEKKLLLEKHRRFQKGLELQTLEETNRSHLCPARDLAHGRASAKRNSRKANARAADDDDGLFEMTQHEKTVEDDETEVVSFTVNSESC
jgi:hypothetical protein